MKKRLYKLKRVQHHWLQTFTASEDHFVRLNKPKFEKLLQLLMEENDSPNNTDVKNNNKQIQNADRRQCSQVRNFMSYIRCTHNIDRHSVLLEFCSTQP